MIIIRRKSINKKFFIIAEDDGKIVQKKRWSKDFTVDDAKRIFRKNKTFDNDISRRKLVSRPFTETTDKRKKPKVPKDIPFRVVITGKLKDNTTIDASSQAEMWESFSAAKSSALENFYERVAQHFNKEYDADEGLLLSNEIVSIKSSVVFVR